MNAEHGRSDAFNGFNGAVVGISSGVDSWEIWFIYVLFMVYIWDIYKYIWSIYIYKWFLFIAPWKIIRTSTNDRNP